MPYLVAIFFVVIIGVFLGFSSVRSETRPTKEKAEIQKSEVRSTARSDIQQRLKALSRSDAPTKLSMGAMCYRVGRAPRIMDYVCPKCLEKTLYTADDGPRSADSTNEVRKEIVACRRILKQIEGLDVELDESEFCAKCTPDLKEVPKICLVVHYEGEKKSHRVEGVTSEDLVILQEFLEGKDKHTGKQGREKPLKDFTQRLSELLGVELAVKE